jgi:hypothetical protein
MPAENNVILTIHQIYHDTITSRVNLNTSHSITLAAIHELPQRKIFAISVCGMTDMENWTQTKNGTGPMAAT